MRGFWNLWLAAGVGDKRFVLYTSPESSPNLAYWYAGEPATGSEADEDPPLPTGLELPELEDVSPPLKPHGLCVDNIRNGLYVIDTDKTRQKIIRYSLSYFVSITGAGATVAALDPYPVVSGIVAKWCAVDGVGNLFFSSDESGDLEDDDKKGSIYKVPAALLVTPQPAAHRSFLAISSDAANPGTYNEKYNGGPLLTAPLDADPVMTPVDSSGTPVAGKLYPASFASVSGPTGVAVDNFRVYWGNAAEGLQQGSVVSGLYANVKSMTRNPLAIAINADEVFGVCLSANNVFFTAPAETGTLFAVRKSGGPIAVVNQGLMAPRGCAHDGDGTIYVADQGGTDPATGDQVSAKVWRVAANMRALGTQKAVKAFDAVDGTTPLGLAVYQPPTFL